MAKRKATIAGGGGFDLSRLPVLEERTTPTPRERDLLCAITALTERGTPPTLKEIAVVMGLSVSRTVTIVDSCQRHRWLTHTPRRSRSFRVLEVPAAK